MSETDRDYNDIVISIVNRDFDDNGINVLYKNNGSDRYPDFKLYKMIARCVHNHTPQAQLERSEFKNFEIVNVNFLSESSDVLTKKFPKLST